MLRSIPQIRVPPTPGHLLRREWEEGSLKMPQGCLFLCISPSEGLPQRLLDTWPWWTTRDHTWGSCAHTAPATTVLNSSWTMSGVYWIPYQSPWVIQTRSAQPPLNHHAHWSLPHFPTFRVPEAQWGGSHWSYSRDTTPSSPGGDSHGVIFGLSAQV